MDNKKSLYYYEPEMEDFESILPITGVPITTLYCILSISVIIFHDHVNLTLAYNI